MSNLYLAFAKFIPTSWLPAWMAWLNLMDMPGVSQGKTDKIRGRK